MNLLSQRSCTVGLIVAAVLLLVAVCVEAATFVPTTGAGSAGSAGTPPTPCGAIQTDFSLATGCDAVALPMLFK